MFSLVSMIILSGWESILCNSKWNDNEYLCKANVPMTMHAANNGGTSAKQMSLCDVWYSGKRIHTCPMHARTKDIYGGPKSKYSSRIVAIHDPLYVSTEPHAVLRTAPLLTNVLNHWLRCTKLWSCSFRGFGMVLINDQYSVGSDACLHRPSCRLLNPIRGELLWYWREYHITWSSSVQAFRSGFKICRSSKRDVITWRGE